MKKPRQYIVIDDDHTSNMICNYLLKRFDPNAIVILFEDPVLALQTFLNKGEDEFKNNKTIVFLDLNMPLMSGWELLDELKKNRHDILEQIEFYILSSSIEDFSKQRELYPSLSGFLSKPLSKAHLQKIEEKEGKQCSGEPVSFD